MSQRNTNDNENVIARLVLNEVKELTKQSSEIALLSLAMTEKEYGDFQGKFLYFFLDINTPFTV
jgi:hypothetical protein